MQMAENAVSTHFTKSEASMYIIYFMLLYENICNVFLCSTNNKTVIVIYFSFFVLLLDLFYFSPPLSCCFAVLLCLPQPIMTLTVEVTAPPPQILFSQKCIPTTQQPFPMVGKIQPYMETPGILHPCTGCLLKALFTSLDV